MGLKCSSDFAQEVMENIFREVEDEEVYIDDIGAFSNSWEEHMALLSTILTLLQDNGFTVNLQLTLSCLGGRLGGVLTLAIYISPNNGPIDLLPSAEMIVHVLAIHFVC
jgi:hypothetical protein